MNQAAVFIRELFSWGDARIVGFHFGASSLIAGCVTLVLVALGGAVVFSRLDQRESKEDASFRGRLHSFLRTVALLVLVWILLQPTLTVESPDVSRQRGVVLLDTSRSMGIADDAVATDSPFQEGDFAARGAESEEVASEPPVSAAPSRWEMVRKALDKSLDELAETYQLECYTFEGQVQSLATVEGQDGTSKPVSESIRDSLRDLEPTGNRTALGAALNHVLRTTPTPSAVVLFSDGVNNWGPGVTESARMARDMGVQLLVVGAGGAGTSDVSIARLDMPDIIPVGESNAVKVHIQQNRFSDRVATVVLRQEDAELDRQEVRLSRRLVDVSLSFVGHVPGKYDYSVEVLPLEGESSYGNNRRLHKATVVDHKPHVLLVDRRPRWEWRFALAGLRRDKRVGGGVKAYLREQKGAARNEDQAGELFVDSCPADLESLSEYDVLVLGDLAPGDLLDPPTASRLSPEQQKEEVRRRMDGIERFVAKQGGGLIILAGPNHAPAEFFGTALGNMLPITSLDSVGTEPFAIQPAPTSQGRALFLDSEQEEPAMGSSLREAVLHRSFLGPAHPMAEVLAVQLAGPSHSAPMPVVLLRRYGRGRVLYIGTDDLWRLRRSMGSAWHHRFWIQAVIQTGMQKILGGDAHVEIKPSKRSYYPGEVIEIQGTAYAKDYSPSDAEAMEVTLRTTNVDAPADKVALHVKNDKPGEFFGELPAPDEEGTYILSAADPVTGKEVEYCLQVTATGPELATTRADGDQLEQLATSAGGAYCNLEDLPKRVRELRSMQAKTLATSHLPLWTSPLLFLLFLGAMAVEWWRRADKL